MKKISMLFSQKSSLRIIILLGFFLFSSKFSLAQQWAYLGSESQIASATTSYATIAVLEDTAYAFFVEGTAAKVKKRNATSGLWEQVGADVGTNLLHTRIYFDKQNNLIVAYLDGSSSNKLAVKMYNPTTAAWEPFNNDANNLYVSTGSVNNGVSQYASTPRFSLVFDSNNVPYIAFGEGTNLTPYVKKFDGTSWVNVGTGVVDAAAKAVGVSLVIDESDVPWLAFVSLSAATSTTGTMALYKLNVNTWVSVPTAITTSIRHTNLILTNANNLMVAYFNTGNLNRATVITYYKATNTWGNATALSSRDAPYLGLTKDISGNLYCSFTDYMASTPRSVLKVFKLNYTDTTGWRELKDPNYTTGGIADTTKSLAFAVGSDTASAFIIYTKTNSSSITTPVVRKYLPPAPPASLTTNAITNFTTTNAVAGGNISSDGGTGITERGIVYATSVNPTTANTKIVDASPGLGSFSINITGLLPATFYNVRAYAINGGGTITYGNNVRVNTLSLPDVPITAPKQLEFLDRGVVAVRTSTTKVYIGWRLLGTDSLNTSFNIYRNGALLNTTPLSGATNYEDNTSTNSTYVVKAVFNGQEISASSPTSVWANNQLSIPLQIPPNGITPDNQTYDYSANDCSVGDVDGDGVYEIFVKWTPSVKTDNLAGYTGTQIIDCYRLDGTKLWRIDLGKNIRAGDHYTQFLVYDFDGDGKAEMICKTADGSKDGTGVFIGDSVIDYRSSDGWVHNGPEFLTVFNGLTGAAMATVNFQPARGAVTDWGDNYGNRCDRFVSAVAYLDGQRPSAIIGRGYYDKLVRAAYDWRNGQLTLRWIFNSKSSANNDAISSNGNHQMTIGDVDGDGKDEIFNGSSAINDNGERLWTSGNGHGDALHMTDMDPDRPGMEMWQCLENPNQYSPLGLRFNDARSGATLWGVPTSGDVGRAMAADLDSNYRGYEVWGSSGNLYDCKGNEISTNKPTYNFGIWWDGDLARELLDGNVIDKWNPVTKTSVRLFTIYNAAPITSNNSTKKNPCLMADLIGDWREEVILRRSDNTALILFTPTAVTQHRIYTLMHDPQYRTAIAWQNSGYNQPPYPSFYLGYNMPAITRPNIYTAGSIVPVSFLSFTATPKEKQVLVSWQTTNEINNKAFVVEHSIDGRNFEYLETVAAKNNTGINNYSITDKNPVIGTNYYRLKQIDLDGKFIYSEVRAVKFSSVKKLNIYPTPASSFIKIEFETLADNIACKLTTADGKLILSNRGTVAQINDAINKILPALASGVYQVQLVDENIIYNSKIVKQ